MVFAAFESPAGAFTGLEFTVLPTDLSEPPCFRVDACHGHLALVLGSVDHAFARVHLHGRGLWLAVAERASVGLLPPIESADVRKLIGYRPPTTLPRDGERMQIKVDTWNTWTHQARRGAIVTTLLRRAEFCSRPRRRPQLPSHACHFAS